jgi:hypothetical protein
MTLHIGRFTALLLTVLSFVFTSCDFNHTESDGKGEVMLSLYSDIVFKSSTPLSDVDDYNFRFVGVDQYATSEYYRYGDVTWPFKWYFGVYKLQAESCTVHKADEGYGCLRYEGISSSFSVMNGKTATASVVCQVANINVNVAFDDSMFETFADFKLVVDTVLPVIGEEGEIDLTQDVEVRRTLEFDTINLSGFYSLGDKATLLRYTLFVKAEGAEKYVESKTGYFTDVNSDQPAVLRGGDLVTFRVKYTGTPVVTPGIKFIVDGNRTSANNSVNLNDYVNKEGVVEDE